MQRPQIPTTAFVAEYAERFKEYAGLADQTLTELFTAFPNNVQHEHVLLKVTALNTLYGTAIWNVFPVAEHIWKQNIDTKLRQGLPELVDEITRIEVKAGTFRNNYSFATKYCSWHVSNAYPIYDSIVERLLWKYQKEDSFSDFKRGDTWSNYHKYKGIIEDFQRHYGLIGCSFKELDKFLWQYGKDYFGQVN